MRFLTEAPKLGESILIGWRWIFRNIPWFRPLFTVFTFGKLASLRITRWMDLGRPVSVLPVTSQTARTVWSGDKLLNLEGEAFARQTYLSLRKVNLSLSRRGGSVVFGNQILVQDNGLVGTPRLYFPNMDAGGVIEQADGQVLVRKTFGRNKIDAGIFGGSLAPHNWFHWVIDTLPTIYLARFLDSKYASLPVLVPKVALERENWRYALELVAGGREVVGMSDDEFHSVKNLVWLEGATKAYPQTQLGPLRGRVSVSLNVLLEYRDFIVATLSLGTSTPQPGRRVFLARRESEVRRYNDKEIGKILQGLGFTRVYLEDLGFEESLRVFREAEFVVGPHGAGWANMLFATPNTKALMWTWAGSYEDNWYQNVAFASGLFYREIHTIPLPREKVGRGHDDVRLADYVLPPERLFEGLESLGVS